MTAKVETHLFGSFVPPGAKYLILGSFTTKEAVDEEKKAAYVWFYANGGRNQFWPILEELYGRKLRTRQEMEELLMALKMAVADIIYQCERKKDSNLDMNLVNIIYAIEDIAKILKNNQIIRIFFTSRFVEQKFKRHFKSLVEQFPNIELVTLPSPSPRFAAMRKEEKIKRYKEELPQL